MIRDLKTNINISECNKSVFHLLLVFFNNMPLHSLCKGKLVEDQTVLSDLGVQGGQTVQVEIQSADPVNKPLKYTKVSPTYKLPDKVNVKIEIGKYILCYNWLLLHSVN